MGIVRWLPQPDDPSIVIIEWEDPERPNGVLTQFIIVLLHYPSNILIQTAVLNDITVHAIIFDNPQLGESSVSRTTTVFPFLNVLTM